MNVQLNELSTQLLEGTGSFCLRSKKNDTGYINKHKWLSEQIEKGLKYVQLMENNKPAGFIEYTEAEYSSRAVYADQYIVIHCLWVSASGKGYGTQLIEHCVKDAKSQGKHGVVVLTNPDTSWTPSKEVFIRNGFVQVDNAPYGFELLVYSIKECSPTPHFPANWDERLSRFKGLTVLRSFQCPYVEIATNNIIEGAHTLGIEATVLDIKNREELLHLSPTPYGVFAAVYEGQLVSFHRLTVHSVIKRLTAIAKTKSSA
ncbi:GNAT family N-acetyltransferase [Neobacillus mesonae]|nr:GNAT family N-acetyltransferase [Neobacillus mesonae]